MMLSVPRVSLPSIGALAVSASLFGCASVPTDQRSPAPGIPPTWSEAAVVGQGAGRSPGDLSRWWQRLRDPVLSDLIRQALASSPGLRSAQAKLGQARARRGLASANRFPTVSGAAAARRTKARTVAASSVDATHDLYTAGLDASWEIDLFGVNRRALEAAQADLQASEAELQGTQVSLAAEVALNYVALRGFQARLAIARDNVASLSEVLQLTEWRAAAGLVTALDVEQSRAGREQALAQVPALEAGAAEAGHRLAILLGRAPGTLQIRPVPGPVIPAVGGDLAVGIPAETLRQRPDVRAAERRLAAEAARLGQAEAARYPSLTLGGSLGLEALTPGGLLSSGSIVHSLLAGLSAPIFDAGRLRRQVEIQSAVQDQALAAYQAVVLTALEDVENALSALAASQTRQQALEQAQAAARTAALLARQQYTAGLIDFQPVLETQRSQLAVEDGLAVARADGASALVGLYKALGGGWSPGPVRDDGTAQTGSP